MQLWIEVAWHRPRDLGGDPVPRHLEGVGRERCRLEAGVTALRVRPAAAPRQVELHAGKEVTVTLKVDRRNGFKGRVPCSIANLPPGVTVVNSGLNGVLVTETQNTRTFTLRAEDWVGTMDQPIYVVGEVESNSPTEHASAPLLLQVRGKKMIATGGRP